MNADYEKHLLETIERLTKMLEKKNELEDDIHNSIKYITENTTKMPLTKDGNLDIYVCDFSYIDSICAYIEKRSKELIEEKIEYMKKKYGK